MKSLKSIYLLAFLALFSACSSRPPISEPQTVPLPEEVPLEAPMEQAPILRAPSNSSQAVNSILNSARSAMQQGQYTQAAAALERGVRIEPRNAALWHYLARVRFSQGRYGLASNLASKSILLARGDTQLVEENRKLIREASAALH